MVLGDFMKWKQTGNKLETNRKQSGINWKQKIVSSCFQLFPVYVSPNNALIMGVLRLCFHCFHFFKRVYIKIYICACKFAFSSTSGNFKKKILKIDFKVSFLYLTGLLLTSSRSLEFDTFLGMLKSMSVKFDAILKPYKRY